MKVLVISHTCFSTYNNMGKTFCSLFSEFEKEELCQLYTYPSFPDVDMCSSYFRVTDRELLRHLFKIGRPGKKVFYKSQTPGNSFFESDVDRKIHTSKNTKKPMIRVLRDLLWIVSPWNSKQLSAWLDDEKPECIFLAPGGLKFIYNIALKISKERKIPIVTYVADDNYFVKNEKGFWNSLYHELLIKKIRKTFNKSSTIITISQEMQEKYSKEFVANITNILTGYTIPTAGRNKSVDSPSTISYFGNIGYNRHISLIDIGNSLKEMDGVKNGFTLDVYTSDKYEYLFSQMTEVETIKLKEFLTGDKFNKIFNESEFLLHVESFDEDKIELTKYSVSTKIADSLASGIPLIAYGPDELASIQHLKRNRCAFVASSKEELLKILKNAFTSKDQREEVVENALKTAEKYHNTKKNSVELKEIFEKAITRKNEHKK